VRAINLIRAISCEPVELATERDSVESARQQFLPYAFEEASTDVAQSVSHHLRPAYRHGGSTTTFTAGLTSTQLTMIGRLVRSSVGL
jgi:hypothetical protein